LQLFDRIPTDSFKFPTEKFDLIALKYRQNWGFSVPNFAFTDDNFPTRRRLFEKFFYSQKIYVRLSCPLASLLCHDAKNGYDENKLFPTWASEKFFPNQERLTPQKCMHCH